jgi:hypothetical protein
MRLHKWNCQNYRYFELGILFDNSCGNPPGTPPLEGPMAC